MKDQNSMTVGELIEILQQMPQDAIVLYRACSDYSEMRPDEVTLAKAEDKKIIYREQNGYSDYDPRWFMTDEQYMAWVDSEVKRRNDMFADGKPRYNRKDFIGQNIYKHETPNFVTVCNFPGN